ncbi:ser/thr kinase [Pandoravirus inopinatum]|uniref:Ser/thr kinase n=1 Tax=Pandoravirus inopinatum TaxID=1605721 RepID=A0A0B5JA09_9VIRU|nr:ser/thr kinase [Pandoravirus inopinatum]AJF97701.1 ser/thr kinase [Pandoravirus inopinatum]
MPWPTSTRLHHPVGVLTREQPYAGMSPAAIAVAVIRDDARPRMPDDLPAAHPQAYVDLVNDCWHKGPDGAPDLYGGHDAPVGHARRVEQRRRCVVVGLVGEDSMPKVKRADAHHTGASWTLPSTSSVAGTGDYDTGSSTTLGVGRAAAMPWSPLARCGWRAPARGHDGDRVCRRGACRVAVGARPRGHARRTMAYNETLRSLLPAHPATSRCSPWAPAASARHNATRARARFAWRLSASLMPSPGAPGAARPLGGALAAAPARPPSRAEEWGGVDDRVLFCGIRARMGIHTGAPRITRDPATKARGLHRSHCRRHRAHHGARPRRRPGGAQCRSLQGTGRRRGRRRRPPLDHASRGPRRSARRRVEHPHGPL